MALTSELLWLLCPHTSLFVFFPAIVIQLKLQHFETPPPSQQIESKVFSETFLSQLSCRHQGWFQIRLST